VQAQIPAYRQAGFDYTSLLLQFRFTQDDSGIVFDALVKCFFIQKRNSSTTLISIEPKNY
jgi:hypothetical protein